MPDRRALSRALAALLLLVSAQLPAQDGLRIDLPERIRISERSNLSTRMDGRYAGLLSRQVVGYLTAEADGSYDGRFFLYEQVRRDLQAVARPIDRSIAAGSRITADTLFAGESPYPSYQDLLRLPPGPLPAGTRWEARAFVLINPANEAETLRLPVLVAYHYRGLTQWNGAPAHQIDAEFATRYPLPPPEDPDDPEAFIVEYTGTITQVRGGHTLTVLLPVGTSQVAFLRDEYREQYGYADGHTLEHEGHVLLFLNGLSVNDQDRRAERLRDRIEPDNLVEVEQTSTGIRLTVRELRFVADQAVLLPGEESRLEAIARALGDTADARFLVVGHTADVGSMESQDALSLERARTIARELAARGVSPDLLDIEGRGGREPVAANTSEEGRAQNRRVEIYVVEP